MKLDFDNLEEGRRITLHPLDDNPIHKAPVRCTYSRGYFYCDGTDPIEGPDYYLGDVLRFNKGYSD